MWGLEFEQFICLALGSFSEEGAKALSSLPDRVG
jgi:hypothetical protein